MFSWPSCTLSPEIITAVCVPTGMSLFNQSSSRTITASLPREKTLNITCGLKLSWLNRRSPRGRGVPCSLPKLPWVTMYPQFFLICSLLNISTFHLPPPPTSTFSCSHAQTGSRSLRYFYVVFLFPPNPLDTLEIQKHQWRKRIICQKISTKGRFTYSKTERCWRQRMENTMFEKMRIQCDVGLAFLENTITDIWKRKNRHTIQKTEI